MKKLLTAMAAGLAAAPAAMASTVPRPPVAVPEISALEGTAALAALAAIVLFTWERRRRAH